MLYAWRAEQSCGTENTSFNKENAGRNRLQRGRDGDDLHEWTIRSHSLRPPRRRPMAGSAHLPPSGAAGGLRHDPAGHRGEEERHQAPAGRRGPAVPPLRGRTDQGSRRRHVPHVDLACSPGRSKLPKVSEAKDMCIFCYLFIVVQALTHNFFHIHVFLSSIVQTDSTSFPAPKYPRRSSRR